MENGPFYIEKSWKIQFCQSEASVFTFGCRELFGTIVWVHIKHVWPNVMGEYHFSAYSMGFKIAKNDQKSQFLPFWTTFGSYQEESLGVFTSKLWWHRLEIIISNVSIDTKLLWSRNTNHKIKTFIFSRISYIIPI